MKIAKRSEKGESKNRPVATNFQFLKILAPLGQLLVGACLPQTLLGTSTANWKLFYLRSINPMIEKINPTIPIPIESSSIPDEQRVITIAKSNIAIPNPIFFTVNPSFENSDLLN